MIELRLDLRSDDFIDRETSPVQEQVVEIDHSERALPSCIRPEQRRDVVPVLLAPRKGIGEHPGKRSLRVHRAGVDIEQRALLRKPPPTLRVPVLLAHEVEHVRGVSRVEHAEPRRQPERRRVPTDEMMGDGMERATQHAAGAVRHRHQRPRALQHLTRRATRERQQQNPFRRDPFGDEPRDPSAQRRGLTGPRPRQDQQRTARMTNRRTLFDIQLLKPRRALQRATRAFAAIANRIGRRTRVRDSKPAGGWTIRQKDLREPKRAVWPAGTGVRLPQRAGAVRACSPATVGPKSPRSGEDSSPESGQSCPVHPVAMHSPRGSEEPGAESVAVGTVAWMRQQRVTDRR